MSVFSCYFLQYYAFVILALPLYNLCSVDFLQFHLLLFFLSFFIFFSCLLALLLYSFDSEDENVNSFLWSLEKSVRYFISKCLPRFTNDFYGTHGGIGKRFFFFTPKLIKNIKLVRRIRR